MSSKGRQLVLMKGRWLPNVVQLHPEGLGDDKKEIYFLTFFIIVYKVLLRVERWLWVVVVKW